MTDVAREQTAFNLLDVNGRSGRLECLIIAGSWMLWGWAFRGLVGPGLSALILGTTFSIALLLTCIRRLHDLGRSGWWTLVTFVPFLNFAFCFWLMIIPGTPGANEYGQSVR